MLTTIIYVMGALSLHFTDLQSESAFFSLLLPAFNFLFFIFLVWQWIFYFALSSFSSDENDGLFNLLYQVWHLDYTIERVGLVKALLNIVLLAVNAISLFVAVYYYLDLFLGFVRV